MTGCIRGNALLLYLLLLLTMSHEEEEEEEVDYRQEVEEEEEEATVADVVVVAGVSPHHNMDHSETLRWLNQQQRLSSSAWRTVLSHYSLVLEVGSCHMRVVVER